MNTLEQLGLWYLRLNGYFTMPNFIAHCHDGARTDVDVLGVRFPHSSEYPDDAARLFFPCDRIDIVLGEAKAQLVLGEVGAMDGRESLEGFISNLKVSHEKG